MNQQLPFSQDQPEPAQKPKAISQSTIFSMQAKKIKDLNHEIRSLKKRLKASHDRVAFMEKRDGTVNSLKDRCLKFTKENGELSKQVKSLKKQKTAFLKEHDLTVKDLESRCQDLEKQIKHLDVPNGKEDPGPLFQNEPGDIAENVDARSNIVITGGNGGKPFFGGKGSSFRNLVNLIPPHDVFISPFLGNCAVLRNIRPAGRSIGVDADREIVMGWKLAQVRVLDLFCCAGGSARGFHDAGFVDITGVDIDPQPNYPYRFIQAEALAFLREYWEEFDFVNLSPPCQGYSCLKNSPHVDLSKYPKLVPELRQILEGTGKPYMIENVPGAPMIDPVILEGPKFGLGVIRKRLFEISPRIEIKVPNTRRSGTVKNGDYVTVAGNGEDGSNSKAEWERAMKIDWMSKAELRQAIPPAYTEFLGKHLAEVLVKPDGKPYRNGFEFHNCDGIQFLRDYRFQDSEFVYCDPPYVQSTRKSKKDRYQHELTDEQHVELLAVLKSLPCRVMVSGYRSELYDRELKDWNRISFTAQTRGGKATENVWINYEKPTELHDYRYLGKDFREREKISRKLTRRIKGIERMPELERNALLDAIRETWMDESKAEASTFPAMNAETNGGE